MTNNNENKLKLYNFTKDPTRKIIEEDTTIYEVDNECIMKNRKNKKIKK